MKILRGILVLGGVVLIVYAIYSALVVQDTPTETQDTVGFTNQTIGMIGIGVLALMAAVSMKNRR